MKVTLLCMGDKMPSWVSQGVAEYAKRLTHDMVFEIKELNLSKRSKSNAASILKRECQQMLKHLSNKDHVVALDVLGKSYSTPKLAKRLASWRELSRPVTFCIGGPEGLHPDVLERADEKISLSELTMPHPLVRIVFVEQLYRAMSVLNNHPYHRQ
ncbi:MAG: 23S rRNA (pseudouridine(1915)-N(3))-methyltransferase RlmH [Pseudomonadota bacterium]